jgi:hypothetical protein
MSAASVAHSAWLRMHDFLVSRSLLGGTRDPVKCRHRPQCGLLFLEAAEAGEAGLALLQEFVEVEAL